MAKLRMAHASKHSARKPPGPKGKERLNDCNNNGQLRIATPPRVAHAKLPGPKLRNLSFDFVFTIKRPIMNFLQFHLEGSSVQD